LDRKKLYPKAIRSLLHSADRQSFSGAGKRTSDF
jgi:hypothetical protein